MKHLTNICKAACGVCLGAALYACTSTAVQTGPLPTKGQQAMIDRKYGMFLHFGMNTYLNVEWVTALPRLNVCPSCRHRAESRTMGEDSQRSRNALHRTYYETPRWLLPLGQ